MKPMLAKKWQDHKKKVESAFIVQPKLNGVRMLYHNNFCQSRDEKFWGANCLGGIREILRDLPDNIILDGELYCHGMSLQQINSRISVNRKEPHKDEGRIEYHVFDCLCVDSLDATQDDRILRLDTIFRQLSSGLVKLVESRTCFSDAEADMHYSCWLDAGYEGMMYRRNAPYGILSNCGNKENRWDTLLKRKDWLDEDCECIGIVEGEGKYRGSTGSLLLQFPDNNATFSAGSGLSDMERQQFFFDPPVGAKVKVKYEMLSDAGIPLKPVIILVE